MPTTVESGPTHITPDAVEVSGMRQGSVRGGRPAQLPRGRRIALMQTTAPYLPGESPVSLRPLVRRLPWVLLLVAMPALRADEVDDRYPFDPQLKVLARDVKSPHYR